MFDKSAVKDIARRMMAEGKRLMAMCDGYEEEGEEGNGLEDAEGDEGENPKVAMAKAMMRKKFSE